MGSYYHGFHLYVLSDSYNEKENESIGQEGNSDTVLR